MSTRPASPPDSGAGKREDQPSQWPSAQKNQNQGTQKPGSSSQPADHKGRQQSVPQSGGACSASTGSARDSAQDFDPTAINDEAIPNKSDDDTKDDDPV